VYAPSIIGACATTNSFIASGGYFSFGLGQTTSSAKYGGDGNLATASGGPGITRGGTIYIASALNGSSQGGTTYIGHATSPGNFGAVAGNTFLSCCSDATPTSVGGNVILASGQTTNGSVYAHGSIYLIGTVLAFSSSAKPLVVKGAASQSANLLEIQNSSSTILNSVDPSGNAYFADGKLSRFSATTVVATGSRNLAQSDNGASIVSTAASAITLTIPTGLAIGFNCTVVQKGAGQVTIGSGTGVTAYAPDGAKSAKQWAMMSALNTGTANEYVIGGNVTA
jgi:hypothetical protein